MNFKGAGTEKHIKFQNKRLHEAVYNIDIWIFTCNAVGWNALSPFYVCTYHVCNMASWSRPISESLGYAHSYNNESV